MTEGGEMVPFSDMEKYMKLMYEQAPADIPASPSGGHSENSRYGVLLLDITDNRVYADGNVKDKAKLVQDGLFKSLGKKIVVLVLSVTGFTFDDDLWQRSFRNLNQVPRFLMQSRK